MAFKVDEVDTNGTRHTFGLSQEGRNRIYVVKLNSLDNIVTCSCKMFESMRLLCHHALRVLNVRNVTKIPPQYILKRWTKDAKSEIGAQEHEALLQQKDKSSVVLRRNNMVRITYDILSKAAMTEKASKIAMEKLKEMEKLIEKDEVEPKGSGQEDEVQPKGSGHKESNEALNDDNISDDNESGCEVDETPVLDPSCAKTKGMSNARWKSSVEKRNKNTSKNKFYPPMNLSAINIQGFWPPPNQVSSLHIPYDLNSDSMALVMPNSSFTSMLLSRVIVDLIHSITLSSSFRV
ncbi:hypothetical protein ACLB2K_069237 [Fragaria x ananassa]